MFHAMSQLDQDPLQQRRFGFAGLEVMTFAVAGSNARVQTRVKHHGVCVTKRTPVAWAANVFRWTLISAVNWSESHSSARLSSVGRPKCAGFPRIKKARLTMRRANLRLGKLSKHYSRIFEVSLTIASIFLAFRPPFANAWLALTFLPRPFHSMTVTAASSEIL